MVEVSKVPNYPLFGIMSFHCYALAYQIDGTRAVMFFCLCICAFAKGKQSMAATSLTATGTHMLHGITECYLPPGRGDIPAFTPAEAGTRFIAPGCRLFIYHCL